MGKNGYRIIIGIVVFVLGLVIGFSLNRGNHTQTKTASSKSTTSRMTFMSPKHTKKSAQRLFINASMNTNGHTNKMGKTLFDGLSYQQINLADEKIPQVGQGDFTTVFNRMKKADVIVIGTPVYWSNMSGYLKTLIDHMQINNDLKGADLYVIAQGADSDQAAAIASTYASLNRISKRFGLNFVGIASTDAQVTKLHDQMIGK